MSVGAYSPYTGDAGTTAGHLRLHATGGRLIFDVWTQDDLVVLSYLTTAKTSTSGRRSRAWNESVPIAQSERR